VRELFTFEASEPLLAHGFANAVQNFVVFAEVLDDGIGSLRRDVVINSVSFLLKGLHWLIINY